MWKTIALRFALWIGTTTLLVSLMKAGEGLTPTKFTALVMLVCMQMVDDC